MDFDDKRTGTGTAEWAEVTENICRGCSNNCLYCYAAHNANRFNLRSRDEWSREELTKRANISSYPARNGVVMFPSSHDITPFNLDAYIRVAKLILEKGNKLLIVSKPRLECIENILYAFDRWKDQILFRFTIGTINDEVSRFWEPGAPLPGERIACLYMAFDSGFQTSVSIEPMLSGIFGAEDVFHVVGKYVTETVSIALMKRQSETFLKCSGMKRLLSWLTILKRTRKSDGKTVSRWLLPTIRRSQSETKKQRSNSISEGRE